MENSYLQFIICGFVFWVIFLFFHVSIYFLLGLIFSKYSLLDFQYIQIQSFIILHYTTSPAIEIKQLIEMGWIISQLHLQLVCSHGKEKFYILE